MGPLPGSQQLEPVLAQSASGRQVDRAGASEPSSQQLIQRDPQDREDRDTQEGLPIAAGSNTAPYQDVAGQSLIGEIGGQAFDRSHRRAQGARRVA